MLTKLETFKTEILVFVGVVGTYKKRLIEENINTC